MAGRALEVRTCPGQLVLELGWKAGRKGGSVRIGLGKQGQSGGISGRSSSHGGHVYDVIPSYRSERCNKQVLTRWNGQRREKPAEPRENLTSKREKM